ncbi:hypothetical protein vBSflM004_126 [Shigella phage vB_SflM_004]|nr:hypothetical protein vBSflM004_126 [Shigella phage vB_SflM_004]
MGHLLKKSWKNLTDMVPHLKRKRKNSEEWEAITKKCFKDLIEMKKFNLKEVEGNYLVLDWGDIREALSEENLDWFEQIIVNRLKMEREDSGKEPLEGIFVKKSYPFFEDTLKRDLCSWVGL